MKYEKHLSEPWFSLVKLKIKTVEGRLNKGIFVNLKVGDIIEFPLGPEMLKLKNFGQKSLDELEEKLQPFIKQVEEQGKA